MCHVCKDSMMVCNDRIPHLLSHICHSKYVAQAYPLVNFRKNIWYFKPVYVRITKILQICGES